MKKLLKLRPQRLWGEYQDPEVCLGFDKDKWSILLYSWTIPNTSCTPVEPSSDRGTKETSFSISGGQDGQCHNQAKALWTTLGRHEPSTLKQRHEEGSKRYDLHSTRKLVSKFQFGTRIQPLFFTMLQNYSVQMGNDRATSISQYRPRGLAKVSGIYSLYTNHISL